MVTYDILGKYKDGKWELLERDIESQKEVDYLLREYKKAFGAEWTFKVRK